jgi:hypothetical protein
MAGSEKSMGTSVFEFISYVVGNEKNEVGEKGPTPPDPSSRCLHSGYTVAGTVCGVGDVIATRYVYFHYIITTCSLPLPVAIRR